MRLLVGVLLALALTGPAFAAETWQSIGPSGGPLSSLAVDPADPSSLLAATPSGEVYESRDAGASWLRTPSVPGSSTRVALGPTRQWAATATGVWTRSSSADGWTQTAYASPVERVFADPLDDRVAWATVGSFGFGGRVVRTVDGGSSWLELPLQNPVGDVLLDPTTPATAYISLGPRRAMTSPICAAGAIDGGVYRATNRGESVVRISTGLEYAAHSICGVPGAFAVWGGVTAVAIIAGQPRILLAAMSAGKRPLYRSTNDGASWTSVGGAFPLAAVESFRSSGSAVYALGRAYPGDSVILRSDDAGESWTTLVSWPVESVPLDQRTLVVAGERLYVTSTSDVGLMRSLDGGATWIADQAGIVARDVEAIHVAPDAILAGDARSVDGGATWSPMPLPEGTVTAFASTSSMPSTLYAATRIGLAVSTNGGGSWRLQPNGPFTPATLAIDGGIPATVYGIVGFGVGLVRSVDAGETFALASIGSLVAAPLATAVATLPGSPAGAFVAVLEDGSVHRTSGADQWERVGDLGAVEVRSLVSSPNVGSAILAATSDGVFRSPDAGATWSRVGQPIDAQTVVPDPSASDVLYAATRGQGVVRSIGGAAWRPFGEGIDDADVRALVTTSAPKSLIAGTIGRSAFRVEIDPCGDGVLDAGEPVAAEASCGLPDGAALSACVVEGKRGARARRRIERLLRRAETALARATGRPARARALTRQGRRALRRISAVLAGAILKDLLPAECAAAADDLEQSLRLLSAS